MTTIKEKTDVAFLVFSDLGDGDPGHSVLAAVSYRVVWEGFCVTELATAQG